MAGNEPLPICAEPGQRKLHVLAQGEVSVVELYRAIRSWEASSEGIVFEQVLEGTGNVQLPDGSRNAEVHHLRWRLAARVD